MADTSVWVDYLRTGHRGRAAALDGIIERGEIVVCGPIAAELVAGTTDRRRDELWQLLDGLRWASIDRAEWHLVGDISAALRQRGSAVPLTDIEIAVAAVASDSSLWTRDAHFDRIADALPRLLRYAPARPDASE